MTGDIFLTSLTKNDLEEIFTNSLRKLINLNPIIDDLQEKIMNQKEAAAFLEISVSTLISWRKRGLVPYEQIQGSSKIRFYKSQLKIVLAQNPGLLQPSRQ